MILIIIKYNKLNTMEYKAKMQKNDQQPHYIYYDFEECAIRSEIINGEICYYIKYSGGREFKAIDNSKIVNSALNNRAEILTRDEYFNF